MPNASTLRGHGRRAYRDGKLVHQAVAYATDLTGRDLTSSERLAVMAGWRDERSEVCP